MNLGLRIARLAATLLYAGGLSSEDVDDDDLNVDGTSGSDCLCESGELGNVLGDCADLWWSCDGWLRRRGAGERIWHKGHCCVWTS